MKTLLYIGCAVLGLLPLNSATADDHHKDKDKDKDKNKDRKHREDEHRPRVSIGIGVTPYGAYGSHYNDSHYNRPYYYDRPTYRQPYYYDERPSYGYTSRTVIVQPPVYQGRVYHSTSLEVDVQRQLARRGYYHGAIDGDIGPGTRAAIRNYQADRGLPITGRIDRALIDKLL